MKTTQFPSSLKAASLSGRLPSIRRALRSSFPTHFRGFSINRNRALDKRGIDGFLYVVGSRRLPVDVKCSSNNPPSDPSEWLIPLETYSCTESGNRGYLLSGGKLTRYVLWLYPNGEWLLLPFRSLAAVLRRFVEEWRKRYRVSRQRTDGYYETYYSECVFVPATVLVAAVTDHVRPHQPRFRVRSSLPIA